MPSSSSNLPSKYILIATHSITGRRVTDGVQATTTTVTLTLPGSCTPMPTFPPACVTLSHETSSVLTLSSDTLVPPSHCTNVQSSEASPANDSVNTSATGDITTTTVTSLTLTSISTQSVSLLPSESQQSNLPSGSPVSTSAGSSGSGTYSTITYTLAGETSSSTIMSPPMSSLTITYTPTRSSNLITSTSTPLVLATGGASGIHSKSNLLVLSMTGVLVQLLFILA